MSYKSVVLGTEPSDLISFPYQNAQGELDAFDLTVVGAQHLTTGTPGAGVPDFYRFDGVDDRLYTDDNTIFAQLTTGFTVLCWAKPRSATRGGVAYANLWANGNYSFQLRLNGVSYNNQHKRPYFQMVTTGDLYDDIRSTQDLLPVDTWVLVGAVWTGASAYVTVTDPTTGVTTRHFTTATSGTLQVTGDPWSVGAQFFSDTSTWRRFFDGDLVPPIVWSTPLADADISAIWAARNDPDAAGVTITPDDSRHPHASDEVATAVSYPIAPDDSRHPHSSDEVDVGISFDVTPGDSYHPHRSDEVDVGISFDVTPDDSYHPHRSDDVTVDVVYAITPADSRHVHSSDDVGITAVYPIAPDDSRHPHASDQVSVTALYVITPGDSRHPHASDQVSVTPGGTVTPADSRHSHHSDQIAIDVVYEITPADSTHPHHSDVVAVEPGPVIITPADSIHSHHSDPVNITVTYAVAPDDSFHPHHSDIVVVTDPNAIPIPADCLVYDIPPNPLILDIPPDPIVLEVWC